MSAEDATLVPLRDYVAVLRNRKWTIVGIAGAVFAATMAWSVLQTPIYRSSADVLVKQINSGSNVFTAPIVTLETESRIATSTVVGSRAGDMMSPPVRSQEFLDHLVVSAIVDTQVLEFSYSDESPQRAQEGARVAAAAYIDYKTEERTQDIEDLRRPLLDELATSVDELAALEADIGESIQPTVAQQAQLQELTNVIANLRSQLAPLSTILIDPGDVIRQATVPDSPSSPDLMINGLFGLLVGLILGIGVASVRERVDDRVRSPADLAAVAGAAVLAVLPRSLALRGRRGRERFVGAERPESRAAESFRTLRTSLMFRAGQESETTILITSPSKREGKTVTAANLAFALAQAGQSVAAISADLRNPTLHRYFGVQDAPGLVDVMDGRTSLNDGLTVFGDNLSFLGSGTSTATSGDLLASGAMRRVMDELRQRAAFVVVDGPAVTESSDALTLSTVVGGVVLVARARSTTRSEVAYARQQLDQVGARVIGCVLNMFNGKVAGQMLASDYRYAAQPQPLGVVAAAPEQGDGDHQPTGRGVAGDRTT